MGNWTSFKREYTSVLKIDLYLSGHSFDEIIFLFKAPDTILPIIGYNSSK